MKYNVAMKWVKALRSGKYGQTTGTLQDKQGYCCLGVLCEIAPKSLVKKEENVIYGGHLGDQPKVKAWSGIKTTVGILEDEDLATFNDKGVRTYDPTTSFSTFTESFTFEEIADIIQRHWKKL